MTILERLATQLADARRREPLRKKEVITSLEDLRMMQKTVAEYTEFCTTNGGEVLLTDTHLHMRFDWPKA